MRYEAVFLPAGESFGADAEFEGGGADGRGEAKADVGADGLGDIAGLGEDVGVSGSELADIPGEARFVEHDHEDDAAGTNPLKIGCEDRLEFDVTLSVVTDDGLIDLEAATL